MEKHSEYRIEIQAHEIANKLFNADKINGFEVKLNNVIIPGYKDIGPMGWITFVFREVPKPNASENKNK